MSKIQSDVRYASGNKIRAAVSGFFQRGNSTGCKTNSFGTNQLALSLLNELSALESQANETGDTVLISNGGCAAAAAHGGAAAPPPPN